jgi:hypothetical protein
MPDAIDAAIDSVPDSIDATPVEAAPEGVTAEAVTDAPQSAEESIDAALEAIYDKNNPPRSEDGKYKATKAEEAAAEGEQEITDQPQTEDDGQPQKVATEPPQSWSAAQREMWAKIPPEARDYIAQRETEATKTISRMGQELSRFRPLNELLSRHQDTFARHGADPQTGVARLLDVQHSLDNDPYGTVAAIAEMYGVDLTAYAAQQQTDEYGGQPQYQPDPILIQTRQELAQLRQQLTEREQRENQFREYQAQELQRQTDEEVSKWSANREHFDNPAVKQMMAAAIANGTADTLDDAYDMAVHAIPSIRQKVTEAERKASEAQRAAEKAKHASQAKRASSVNAGTARRAANVPSGKWDSEEYMNSVFERAAGG